MAWIERSRYEWLQEHAKFGSCTSAPPPCSPRWGMN